MTFHNVLVFLHILMFCLWLGMDIGVYYAGKFTVRRDLTLAERRRFFELLILLDMGPRTALVLLAALGIQMAVNLGLIDLSSAWLAAIWIVDLVWLALVWLQFLRPDHPISALAKPIDYGLRYLVIGVFVAWGSLAFLQPDWVIGNWLRLKMILFGAVVAIGLILRATIPPWLAAMADLEHPEKAASAQQTLELVYRRAGRWAHSLWLLVTAIAFLGTVKPF